MGGADNGGEYVPPKEVRLVAVVARLVTAATLLVAVVVLELNHKTLENGYKMTYSDWNTYSYMFYISIIVFVYNLLQIPFAIYHLRRGKRLLHHHGFLQFEFYADKISSFLLATALGAGFGATLDMKKYTADEYKSIYYGFFNMAYISVGFLLVGFFTSGISSIFSSFAVSRNSS